MKVGLLHPRSGVGGMWAPAMDAAAMVGAAELNAGGSILGDEIELVVADCGFSVGEALEAVDTLIEVEGVGAIIGGHTSNIRDAVTRRVSGRIPYIYTPQYEGIACGPSTVAIGSTDDELMAPALAWLKTEKQAERFFFVGNDYIWGRMALDTTRRLMRKAQGADLVGQAIVPTSPVDHSEILKQIARSGAQVVIQALVGLSSVEFNRAFAAAGLDQKMLRFGLIVDETVICGIGAEASTNLFTAANYFADQQSRSNDHFLELYHDAFGDLAPPVSAGQRRILRRPARARGTGARFQQTRNGQALARRLQRPMSLPRSAIRHRFGDQPLGQWPMVYMGEANGVTIQVVAALTH